MDSGPNYATGLYLGGFGIGASVSVKTNLSLIAGDQIQWRTTVSGIDIQDSNIDDFNDIDYEDVDVSVFALRDYIVPDVVLWCGIVLPG